MSRTKPEVEEKQIIEQTEKDSGLSCITDYRTDVNIHEVSCRDCGKLFYADEQTMLSFERAMAHDLDNPFVCYKCEQEEEANTTFE
jgi:hypothetical protein